MTKHSKNTTSASYYSYGEREKGKEVGWGSKKLRLGKDSLRKFDCCWLSQQRCKQPVVTPNGYLFDRESILECLLHQKLEIARQTKEYEKQERELEQEKEAEIQEKEDQKLAAFVEQETKVAQLGSNSKNEKKGLEKNFWIPSNTPTSKTSKISKPKQFTTCPISGKKLRLKDLVDVNWTFLKPGTPYNSAEEHLYKCPITHETLTDNTKCVVLKPSGRVITQGAVDTIIKKEWVDPIDQSELKDSDLIELQRGATSFAAGAGNNKLNISKYETAMFC
eukprot:Lithocolla_globosa_v1_NODE_8054_length_867_cov_7.198276.p1 type:complete len:278 gc:universal NODE_8054_length_867_cov_7.198276:837-4(-)